MLGHDAVVLPTYVCRSVLEAFYSVGGIPQLCDVNKYGVIETNTVSNVISIKTKAIIAVHTFGNPCDIAALRTFGIPIIEDACQAFGLKSSDKIAGSDGDVGILSFHATKCITTGEGGMLLTNDSMIGDTAKSLLLGGASPKARFTAQFNDLQAALGLSQLDRYERFKTRRLSIYHKYKKQINELGLDIGNDPKTNLPFRFTIKIDKGFDYCKNEFEKIGITVRLGVDELLHSTIGVDDKNFPEASSLIRKTVSVPFYPALSEEEVNRVLHAMSRLK